MQLPKQDIQQYEVQLEGIGQKVKFRPFTVKEQKILLTAKQSEDNEQIKNAVKQIISLCTFEKVDADSLPYFDLEMLMIHLRARSVGEGVKVTYKIKAKEEGEKDEIVTLNINLEAIKVHKNKKHEKIVKFDNSMGVRMKYPTIDIMSSKESEDFEMVFDCIESVYKDEDVFYMRDFSKEERDEWVESLSFDAMQKLSDFMKTMPRVRYETKIKAKDGREFPIKLEGLEDFFM